MGMIVDNTKSKMGKSRPYLLFVPIFMGIATIMCFSSPNLSYNGKIAWIYISYILWGNMLYSNGYTLLVFIS